MQPECGQPDPLQSGARVIGTREGRTAQSRPPGASNLVSVKDSEVLTLGSHDLDMQFHLGLASLPFLVCVVFETVSQHLSPGGPTLSTLLL